MATREIKTTLSLDGAAKFRSELSAAQRNVSQLGSELGLAASQFRATGDAQQYMQTRSKTLRAQIDQQEEIVRALEGALKDAEKAYGQNSAKADQYRQKLTQAKTNLSNMSNELSNNERGLDRNGKAFAEMGGQMDKAGTSAKNLSGELKGISTGVKLQNLKSGLESVSSIIERAAQNALRIGKNIWQSGVEASQWADDLLTQSSVTGIDTDTLQQWSYASRFVDVEVSTLSGSMKKLTKNMSSSTKEVTEAWKSLGVSVKDNKGHLRDSQTVFWDTIEALGRVENETERNTIAMTVFGKSATELNPLIEAGRKQWEAYGREAKNNGLVMDAGDVKQLGDFNDQWQKMQATLDQLKNRTLASLAPAFGTVSTSITNVATKIAEFLETEEGQNALKQFSSNIAELATNLGGTVTDFLKNLPKYSESLSGFFDIISGKNETANTIAGIAGGLWAGSKLATVASSFTQIATAFSGISGTAGGVGTAVSAIGGLAAGVGGILAVAGGLKLIGDTVNNYQTERIRALGETIAHLDPQIDPEALTSLTEKTREAITSGAKTIGEVELTLKPKYETGRRLYESFTSGDPQLVEQEYNTLTKWVQETMESDMQEAEKLCATYWDSVYDAAYNPPEYDPKKSKKENDAAAADAAESAADAANDALKESPLYTTLKELQSVRSELDTVLRGLYMSGRTATESELDRIDQLMSRAEELQGRLDTLKSDTVQMMQQKYDLVTTGHGVNESEISGAFGYVDTMYQLDTEASKKKLEKAAQDHLDGVIDDAAYEAAEKTYKQEVADAGKTRTDRINKIFEGMGIHEGITPDITGEMGEAWKIIENLQKSRTFENSGYTIGELLSGKIFDLIPTLQNTTPNEIESLLSGADLGELRKKYPNWQLWKGAEEGAEQSWGWLYNRLRQGGRNVWDNSLLPSGDVDAIRKEILASVGGEYGDLANGDNFKNLDLSYAAIMKLIQSGDIESFDTSMLTGVGAMAAKRFLLEGGLTPEELAEYNKIGGGVKPAEVPVQPVEEGEGSGAEAGEKVKEDAQQVIDENPVQMGVEVPAEGEGSLKNAFADMRESAAEGGFDHAIIKMQPVPSGEDGSPESTIEELVKRMGGKIDENKPEIKVEAKKSGEGSGTAAGEQGVKDAQAVADANPIRLHIVLGHSAGVSSGTLNSLFGNRLTMGKTTAYAEGGRADGPSVFGEAGAEWAIPEQHSARTAELLRAAANASGFTWAELAYGTAAAAVSRAASRTSRGLAWAASGGRSDSHNVTSTYIDKYYQNSAGDIESLADSIAARAHRESRGYGA